MAVSWVGHPQASVLPGFVLNTLERRVLAWFARRSKRCGLVFSFLQVLFAQVRSVRQGLGQGLATHLLPLRCTFVGLPCKNCRMLRRIRMPANLQIEVTSECLYPCLRRALFLDVYQFLAEPWANVRGWSVLGSRDWSFPRLSGGGSRVVRVGHSQVFEWRLRLQESG